MARVWPWRGQQSRAGREPRVRIEQRLDEFLQREYQRRGASYPAVMLRVGVVQAIIAIVAMVPACLRYVAGVSFVEGVATTAFVAGLAIAASWVVLIPRWNADLEPLTAWLESRDPRKAVAAAECQQLLALRLAKTAFHGGFLPVLVGTLVWARVVLDLSIGGLLLGVIGSALVFVWPLAANLHLAEILSRPVRRDLAEHLRHTDELVGGQDLPIRVRLLLGVASIAMLTGVAVAFAATMGDGNLVEVFWLAMFALVVTVTASGFLVLLVVRSLTGPLDDLMATTTAVAGGNLMARAPVTSDDELGALATSLNSMLESLQSSAREVQASRERIVAASLAERRRVERNIHDGAQQQLVALALRLRVLERKLDDRPDVAAELDAAVADLQVAMEELRALAQGLHPSVLDSDGLGPALQQLAERGTIPVTVTAGGQRYPDIVESTVWFVASEALANVAKYASASSAAVSMAERDGRLVVEVSDDGIGGAHLDAGSGLRGLVDRVEAVGGRLTVDSPAGGGTTIRAELPLSGSSATRSSPTSIASSTSPASPTTTFKPATGSSRLVDR